MQTKNNYDIEWYKENLQKENGIEYGSGVFNGEMGIITQINSYEGTITINFEDGKMAVLYSDMLAQTDRQGVISGDKGYLEIQNINNCEQIRVFDLERKMTACYQPPEQINGYEYEVLSCVKAIEEGRVECPEMPHSEILRVMRLMDEIRGQWGMQFPCE